jgi:hypothetical protein
MRSNQILPALLVILSAGSSAAEPTVTPSAFNPVDRAAAAKARAKAEYKGPNETDIRVAYTAKIDAINAGTRQYLDPQAAQKLLIHVAKVDFVECEPFEGRTDLFVCNVLVESAVGAAGADFKRMEMALYKEKDAWRVK